MEVIINNIIYDIALNEKFATVTGCKYNVKNEEIEAEIDYCGKKIKVTKIKAYAFSNQNNLENIIIPNSIKIIGKKAFLNCKKLQMPIIPASVTTIGLDAFQK